LSKIIVCGEALIDLVPRKFEDEAAYVAMPGGSPFNIAKAVALAGGESFFHGALSTDFFGELLLSDLRSAGVRDELIEISDKLTTLAFVDFAGISPRYAFYNVDTPSVGFKPGIGDFDVGEGAIIAVGSISLIDQPAADRIAEFAIAESKRAMLAFDPNVRPQMIKNRSEWERRIGAILDAASIVKLSAEDLDYISPGSTRDEFAASVLTRGAALVLVTDGENGAAAFSNSGRATEMAPGITVADTVGAGDSFMGAALVWLAEQGMSNRRNLPDKLSSEKLEELLRFATRAAAINCTRTGCSPPTRIEIEEALGRN